MKDFEKKQELAYELNMQNFYHAFRERNFDEMSDIYNEMTKYNDKEVRDGENTCFFTEILDGYKIKFPITAAGIVRSFGQDFYYALNDDCIDYIANESPDDFEGSGLFFETLKSEHLEADRVKLTGDTVTCTAKAVKVLALAVGDIIKILIYDKAFSIQKYDNLFLKNNL